jgi:hypothetical protein
MSENEYNLAWIEKKYKTSEEAKKAKQNNILKAQEARKKNAAERREAKNKNIEDSPDEEEYEPPKINIKDYVYYDEDSDEPKKKKKNNDDDLLNLIKDMHNKIDYNIKKVDKLYYMKKNKIAGGQWKKEEKPIIINNQLPTNNNNDDSVYNAIRAKIIKQ